MDNMLILVNSKVVSEKSTERGYGAFYTPYRTIYIVLIPQCLDKSYQSIKWVDPPKDNKIK
jgi:hypothetical protein